MELIQHNAPTTPTIKNSRFFSLCDGLGVEEGAFEEGIYIPAHVVGEKSVAPSIFYLEVKGGVARPLRAEGGLKAVIASLAERNVSISVDSVLIDKHEASRFQTLLRSIIRRGFAYAKEITNAGREVEALMAFSNVSPRQFIREKTAGSLYVHFKSGKSLRTGREYCAWYDRTTQRSYDRFGVVFTRNDIGEIAATAWLEENKDLIGEECRKFKDPKNNFSGLDYPIGDILVKVSDMINAADKRSRTGLSLPYFEAQMFQAEAQMLQAESEADQ